MRENKKDDASLPYKTKTVMVLDYLSYVEQPLIENDINDRLDAIEELNKHPI